MKQTQHYIPQKSVLFEKIEREIFEKEGSFVVEGDDNKLLIKSWKYQDITSLIANADSLKALCTVYER